MNTPARRLPRRGALLALLVLTTPAFLVKPCRADGNLSDGNLMLPPRLLKARVLLNCRDMSGSEALNSIFRQADVRYILDEPVEFAATIKMTHPSRLEHVLEIIGRAYAVDFRLDAQGRFHVFRLRPDSGVPGRPDLDTRRFYLTAKEPVPIRDLLANLFQQADVEYEIDPAITAKFSAHYGATSFRDALKLLLMRNSGMPLTFRVENGKYIVYPYIPPR